jgi:hypothetical protein
MECTPPVLLKMHQESMKSLLIKNGTHSDVVLVSAEKHEHHAHTTILSAHSSANIIIKKIFIN